jgi:HlyD family secretion protein
MSGSQFDIPSLPVTPDRNRVEAAPVKSERGRVVPASPLPHSPPLQSPGNNELQLPEQLTSPRRNRRRWLIGGAALALAALAYFRFFSPTEQAEPYRVSPVERRAIRQTVEAFGSLDVASRVYVPAARAGQLTSVMVKRGQMVEAGQELAKLDPTGAAAELSAAQIALSASGAKVESARAARNAAVEERKRAERLLEKGLVSASMVSAAREAEAEATAALRGAEAQRQLDGQAASGARTRREETTLRAPVSGFVLSAVEDVGGVVGPQTGPLFVITPPLEQLLLTVPISEADIGLVRIGQEASFSVSAHPEKRFPAQIGEIESEPQRTGSSVSYRVRLRVNNPERLLLPGMTANVTLEIAKAEETLAVREAALRFTPGEAQGEATRSRVWREKQNGDLEPVEVTVGLSDGAFTAVTPNPGFTLQVGDQVAVGLNGSARGSSKGGSAKGGPGISLGTR